MDTQNRDSEPSNRLIQTGPIAWMARNSVAANLLMFVVLVGGIISGYRLKQEVFPQFSLDAISVRVPYPGASPEEAEQGIVLAVEESIRGIEGVKVIRSVAAEGIGSVTAELILGADPNKLLADIKAAVDRIPTLPEEAERPIVSLLDNKREVISLVLAGDYDLATLHSRAEGVRQDLLALPQISQVEIFGVRALEVSVELERETLESFGLSLDDVARQVTAASVELPGGGLDTLGGELLVRVSDRKRNLHEFENIILKGTSSGYAVRLGDIATVNDGYEDTDRENFFNGKRAVRLTAYRVGAETPIGVANAVKAYAERLQPELPPGMTATIWNDDSEILKSRIDLLLRNAQMGLVLVLVVLASLLQIRLALWVALGIPTSFLGAMILMNGADASINMITLFAFLIVLGMVVDDAIVIGENVYHHIQNGIPPLQAAIQGTKEMAVPVTFSCLTTVAAFGPLFFVPGFTGKIFGLIPVVVIAVLLISLIESFYILPAHLGHGLSSLGPISRFFGRIQSVIGGALEYFVEHYYQPTVALLVRQRYITVAGSLVLLMLLGAMVGAGLVPFSFFPKLEGDLVIASARLPYGAPIERTKEIQRELEAGARRALEAHGGDSILRGLFTRLGEGPMAMGGTSIGSHLVTVEVALVPSDLRSVGAATLASEWEKQIPPLAGVEALTVNYSTGPGAGAAVNVALSHADNAVLGRASAELAVALQSFPILTSIDNAFASGKPQLDYTLLPAARTLGLTSSEIGRQLRSAFFGAEALREQRGRNELRVMVRLPESQRQSEFDLETMRIRTPAGGFVPLSQVATFERGRAPTSILREDGQREVAVTAELVPGEKSAREVLESLTSEVLPRLTEKYSGLTWRFRGQQQSQAETFASLGPNYLFALFVIYAMLAIPFRSYFQPVIIMAVIPFGLVGAIGGHLMLGYELTVISLLGLVALSGVVVNDSLVLIDATNQFRREGMTATDAVIRAGMRRMRPILLTSLTTFFGLVPMIAEKSVQARFLIPMAISLGFGVLFATFIVLLLVPAMYMVLDDILDLVRRVGSRVGTLLGARRTDDAPALPVSGQD